MSHDWIDLDTPHGRVRAWQARPDAPPRAAVVVLQEIFGVNAHIRDVTARFAAAGYLAIAPALYDPIEPGVELDYDAAGVERGRELRERLGFDRALDIVDATARHAGRDGLRVATVGFCWGGSAAFLANTRLALPAVSYYGARSMEFIEEAARAPLLFHFGALDPTIPEPDIERHRACQPGATLHVYPDVGHAFNRESDATPAAREAASLAWGRTLAFLAEHLQ